ncbi:Pkinase domain-containing protein/Pkinase_Tyr domain-containing protein [Cephalotus follicularis]|uniref:Pkinase domain-containing protein/Pkinase_Tyr domain-containing protein n=1 Tax=Cephalotus follicularis TaxID=3775 RepID=A0A1Q3BIF3_CEPFO|nr:Pkinase domain-containing protein/Pkinase_Tyr domain-containing protein [Cephalotus follicularis]
MHLNRLCFLLPADSDEILPYDQPKLHLPSKYEVEKHPQRDCGGQVLDFIGHSLRRLYDSKWVGFCHHKESRKQHSGVFHDLEGVQLSEKVGGDNPRIFSYAELYIGSNGFSEDGVLGSGGFGKVYKAVLPSDGTAVAVKCLAEKGERFEKTFAAELVAVAHLRHRNLVRLRGWCVHDDELLLVYDYMPNRSLDRVLFRRPENMKVVPLDWDMRRKIVGGLAAALFYLHEQLETQIIHRDVKTSNVMLDSHYNARLGDFGLARWLEHELEYQIRTPSAKNHQFRLAESSRIGGTIGYLPPESFQKKSVATAKSDVFSFGIVVLEVVSGRRAVDLSCSDGQMILLDWIRRLSDEGKLLQAGDNRLTDGSYSLSDMERLIHIGLLCTLHNPQQRPNMKWVVEALSGNNSSKLPVVPSFQSHPLYISLSSPTNSSTSNTSTSRTTTTASTNTTVTSASSCYVTATGETIYATAEFGNEDFCLSNSRSQQRTNFFMVETPREISYKEIISATNNFSDSQRVAELDFGTAYHGFLDNCHRVLIKRLGMTKCPALRTRFSNELQNLARLRHRNLVQLRGWCTEQGEMLVVYDYSANHLLSHLLFHHDNRIGHSILQWHYRYNIVKSLASAIQYLHEEWDEQVIHRSITSSAVILDSDMNPRLSSFALAEFLSRNDHDHHAATIKNKSVCGIFGYMAPEYLESGEATPMADVYSFGVVVLEVVSGQMAVDFRRPEVLLIKRVQEFEAQNRPLEELVDIRLNGEYNHRELMRLVKLGIVCTCSNPGLRPGIRQIVRILDGNDKPLMEEGHVIETREEWKQRNASSLSLVKSIQALGIQ